MLPAIAGDDEQLRTVRRFLTEKKVFVAIEPPNRKDATQTLRQIDESMRPQDEDAPYFLYLGEKATIRLAVTNVGVGHRFPGGTTDINQAWLYVRVSDAANRTLFEQGRIDERGRVDRTARVYQSVLLDREGRHVWKHDLFNAVGELYNSTLLPGQSDTVDIGFTVPYWAKGPLTVTALIRYRKFNRPYADWALGELSDRLPVVDIARDSLVIPLRIRPPARFLSGAPAKDPERG